MSNKIINTLKNLIIFLIGNIFSYFVYDRKYLTGKYFYGKFGGINALGWRWIVSDCMARIFFGINKGIPFPVSPRISIVNPNNIYFYIDDLHNFQGIGNYFQAINGAKIVLNKGCWIAQNVGFITSNHDINDPDKHVQGKDIILGKKCWIGMNSVILPGVTLGDHTTVGAGSVVTKSFSEGYCVIAGNPARKIKDLKMEL